MKITFLLPTVRISGGVRSTFEIANRLLDRGHDVKIVYPTMLFGRKWYTPRQQVVRFLKTLARITSKNNVDWFDIRADLIRVPTLEEKYIPKGDIVVATWWENVHDLNGYGKEKGEK